ncbi:monovalent cation/H(+) antiporter subunit G [Ruicaihuangia caeni]|uniref:monovalent cation/H(+) antiporter subunit G n=1 Tax=Ruicaihuangia caeni TaxID=3042517 RepID=UPI00338FE777
MNVDAIIDGAALVCLALGAFLSMAAGVGLLRFPDALSRMHAATKPQIMGLFFVIAAIALDQRSWVTVLILVPVVVLQTLTAPISAHMIGRAAYRTHNFSDEHTLVDELAPAVDKATREQRRSAR